MNNNLNYTQHVLQGKYPSQISNHEWHELSKEIPDEQIESTRYYRDVKDAEWSKYLFPPSAHLPYGMRLLRKLKFDNSLAAMRLWGFVLSEGERIYRARQAGKKVIAVMGDLGAITPLIYSFPDTVAFYPDCLWWTPFLMESHVLFNEAEKFGLGEDCCFVRAALGAFSRKAYFPEPDLCIGTTGSTCDDMAAVMSEVEYNGNRIEYIELPHRRDEAGNQNGVIDFLAAQYKKIVPIIEKKVGQNFSEEGFRKTLEKVNTLRSGISELKDLVSRGVNNPIGALEMLISEFINLSYYGDLHESLKVIDNLKKTVEYRVESKVGYENQNIRLVWITPPADPLLMNYVEELGGRIVGSEYLIRQSSTQTALDGDLFVNLAKTHVKGSLMGTSAYRANLISEEIESTNADGAIISGIFGSSHCPWETGIIVEALREKSIPVLAFDVVAPGKKRIQSQVYSRLEAFMEALAARKLKYIGM